ncbi:nucleotide exchange factor GrpE [Oceanobacillus sp. APA_J-5(13-2)]|nr:nucleotide exchange factor GrpE [Oceanobacillus alkalisoli]MCG5103095.1 nucleotide exchange factor GrpE [Oceanobacillus alkalisoli]
MSLVAENKEQAQANEEVKAEEAEVVEEAEQEVITDEKTVNADELAALQKEKDDLYDRILRLQAEYDNFKRRSQKEKEAERKYKAQDLVNDLLPVLDNFERALQVEQTEATSNLIEGISMVYRQLQDALTNNGVEVIDTEGKEFDPNLHHAVMQVEDENHESNHIVEELQKGYMLKDRVIRPSMVKVNK